jgi:hypothetical protein
MLHRRKAHRVSGHPEIPEASANQPLVRGHGPSVKRSHRPPPPARTAQIHPVSRPSTTQPWELAESGTAVLSLPGTGER